jgi:NuA3 HAT complex component NTO1
MQLQQEEEEEELQCRGCAAVSSSLPTKKRKESRDPHLAVAATATATAYCLPAKKRVWALQPDFFAHEPLSPPLDLNVEYKPSPAFEGETEAVKEDNDGDDVAEDDGGDDDDDDDDGIVCAVCQSTDGDPSDPIVFCDGCDLMVHATCFGNPLVEAIPDDDWFCAQCIVSSSKAKKDRKSSSCCCLCPIKGGALKPTVEGRWAHIVCTLLVPEVLQHPRNLLG